MSNLSLAVVADGRFVSGISPTSTSLPSGNKYITKKLQYQQLNLNGFKHYFVLDRNYFDFDAKILDVYKTG